MSPPVKAPKSHRPATPKSSTNGQSNGKPAPVGNKPTWQILWIAVDRIDPNPFQPRLTFDALEMAELVASVRERGVQQPVIVRSAKSETAAQLTPAPVAKAALNGTAQTNGKSAVKVLPESNGKAEPNGKPENIVVRYELVAGERRLRACREANKRFIPAIVRDDLSDAQAAELALLENVQRSNLSVIEEAKGYKRLMIEFRMKEERLAKKVGKSVATIREIIKLLQLPESVQTLLWQKKLTASHGHALLPLAPFEKACASVANHAARQKLTAVSLEGAPLPNPKELKSLGVLVELDFKTKFNWQSVCGQCVFKAYVRSGHSSYCLKPDEWEKKQIAALAQAEQQKEEATQVMEQARRENNGIVEVEHLPVGSYRDLSFGDPPQGCSAICPCFKETVDPRDPTKTRPVCLDPNRYRELVQAEREAEEEKRRNRFNAFWESAKSKLLADVETGDLRRTVVLLATPILRSMYDENGYVESWRQGVEEIASELDVSVLEEFLNTEADSEAYGALDMAVQEGIKPEKLLLLCALLMLAEEARTAIRFIRETPGLDFVLENKQAVLEEHSSAPSSDLADDDALNDEILDEDDLD